MGYLDSYNLGRDSKAIITGASAGKYNYKGLLSSQFSSFYKTEILSYVAGHFDKDKDDAEVFRKVLDMVSLDISDVPNAEILFSQIAVNQEDFREYALLSLKDMANNIGDISKINDMARKGVFSKSEYASLIAPVIDRNAGKDSLFNQIAGEIEGNGFSKDNSGFNVTEELVGQYLSRHKTENWRVNGILDIVGGLGRKDKETEAGALEDECVINLLIMSSKDSPEIDEKDVRMLAITSLTEKDLKHFDWPAAIGAFDVLADMRKENPRFKKVAMRGIKNLLDRPDMEYCIESFIKSGLKDPGIAEEITKKMKEADKHFKPGRLLWLPVMAELNGGAVASGCMDITAAAIRENGSYHQIKAVFDKINENIADKNGEYHRLDFNSGSYGYLAFVALNDSRLNAHGAYALSKELWAKSIEEGGGREESVRSLKEIIKIIGGSRLIKKDKEVFSRMMAKMKSKEFSQNYPEDVRKLINKIVSAKMPEVKADTFINRLIDGAVKHDNCYDEYFNEAKPAAVYEKTLETVENIVKNNRLEPKERKNIASSIEKLYEVEEKVDHKRCGSLIRSLNFSGSFLDNRNFNEGRK